jgi:hypothetical protein
MILYMGLARREGVTDKEGITQRRDIKLSVVRMKFGPTIPVFERSIEIHAQPPRWESVKIRTKQKNSLAFIPQANYTD